MGFETKLNLTGKSSNTSGTTHITSDLKTSLLTKLGISPKTAGISRDLERNSAASNRSTSPTSSRIEAFVKEVSKIFSKESIDNARRGDLNALYRVNRYANGQGHRLIEKYAKLFSPEIKRAIKDAQEDPVIKEQYIKKYVHRVEAGASVGKLPPKGSVEDITRKSEALLKYAAHVSSDIIKNLGKPLTKKS